MAVCEPQKNVRKNVKKNVYIYKETRSENCRPQHGPQFMAHRGQGLKQRVRHVTLRLVTLASLGDKALLVRAAEIYLGTKVFTALRYVIGMPYTNSETY